jgi:uncharacterized protein
MFYLDSCFVVASLVDDEVYSNIARQWLRANAASDLAISPWVETEVASAASMKVRTKDLSLEKRAEFLLSWHRLRDTSLATVMIENGDFEIASSFASRHELSLRGSDALHIAIASRSHCTLVTLDQKMADAATILGVPVAAI